jgi:hypothetical protein
MGQYSGAREFPSAAEAALQRVNGAAGLKSHPFKEEMYRGFIPELEKGAIRR